MIWNGFILVIDNVIIKVAYCTCVTIAAIHFNNHDILWWYLLSFMFGYTYKSDNTKGE